MFYSKYKSDLKEQYRRISSLKSEIFETPAGTIEYLDYGSGQPVLLIHGVVGGCDQAADMSDSFFGEDFRIIAVSRFGYLKSPLPEDASPAAQADLYALLLDALCIEKIIVAGFSAGGPSALQFALRHPDRVALLIQISMAVPPYNIPGKLLKYAMKKFFSSDLFFWFIMNYFSSMMLRLMGIPFAVQKKWTASEAKWQKKLMWKLLQVSLRTKGIVNDICITNPDLNKNYPVENIRVPALIFHAVDDPMPPFETAKEITARIPGAQFIQINSGGHLLVGHHKKVQNMIRDFIKEKITQQ